MNRALPILLFLVLAQWNAVAQTNATAQPQTGQNQTQTEITKSQEALRDFLNAQSTNRTVSPGTAADLDTKFLEFRMAIPRFREVTQEYSWTLSMKGKLDKDLKSLQTQSDILLRYLSAAKINHPRPDAQEFKDFSTSELEWETLNVAERIGSFLNLAVAVERKNVASRETLEFLYTLDGDLQRLKWLTSHTK